MRVRPRSRKYCRQSAIQSTCCSHAKIVWLLTSGLCGTGDHEKVGEAGHHDPEIGAWPTFPLRPYRQPRISTDVDLLHRAGHRVKTGRKSNCIKRVLGIGDAQPGRRDFLDWLASGIDQGDVVTIVG